MMKISTNNDLSHIDLSSRALFIGFVGYEKRSIFILQSIKKEDSKKVLYFGMKNTGNVLSNIENHEFLANYSVLVHEYERYEINKVIFDILMKIRELRKEFGNGSVQIHFDYSSMPRDWYCNIVKRLIRIKNVNLHCWYTSGRYASPEQYPCAGVGDFSVFHSTSRITSNSRISFLGLGLDWVRSNGILEVINSEEYYSILVHSDKNEKFYNILRTLNWEIISEASNSFEYPINDFAGIYYGIKNSVSNLLNEADIELVADGPKPLILAMSLVSTTTNKNGLHCWHVGHSLKTKQIDVIPEGIESVYGFKVAE